MKRLSAERDENTCRKPFTPSEAVEIGKRLEALLKPEAEAREKAGVKPTEPPSGNLPEGKQVRDQVAEAVGMSGRTYDKAKAVVEAATKPDATPEVKQAAAGESSVTFSRGWCIGEGSTESGSGRTAVASR